MKLATFIWSWTVEVPDDFDEDGVKKQVFESLHYQDGELTDLKDKEEEEDKD